MIYVVIMFFTGLGAGAGLVFAATMELRSRLNKQKETLRAQAVKINEAAQTIKAKSKELEEHDAKLILKRNQVEEELEVKRARFSSERKEHEAQLSFERKQVEEELEMKRSRFSAEREHIEAEREEQMAQLNVERKHVMAELEEQWARLAAERKEFEARVVSYEELKAENALIKRDLSNLDVKQRKLILDREKQREKQQALDERGKELGGRYLKENVKWIGSSLSANNYTACKQRLLDVIERCRGIGFEVSQEEQDSLLADLKAEFEKMVRAALEREEQSRIKAQIREEQKLQREVDRELKQLERERAAIQAALEKALAEAKDQHSEEVERLKARLAEAEENSKRAVSRAQMTKSGYIYVISNIGSFGENTFKIGMTRRLEPNDRVRELGDSSVPFPFDVHMMISCDDAPALENALHRLLHKHRLNKIKPRKEFFKTDIETIRKVVLEHHGEVEYVADPEALEYHQSLTMTDEDAEYIEQVYEEAADEDELPASDVD